MLKMKNKYGIIAISDLVIARIVGGVATSCFGVVGMAARTAADNFASLLKWENMERGIDISCNNNESIDITLHIIMTYGVNIAAISDSIRNSVCHSVYELTGAKVSKVSIIVESLKM